MDTSLRKANPDAPLSGTAQNIDKARLTAIVWTCFSVATCFVILRLTVRWRQNGMLLADDWWITWAWMCLLTMAILQTEQMASLYYVTYLLAGRVNITADTPELSVQLSRWQFPIIKLFWTVLWSVKASFLAVFFRLGKPFAIYRRIWYGVAIFTFLAYVGCVVSSVLTCNPPSDYFVAGQCNSEIELWRQRFNVLWSTSLDITTDLLIMSLPIALLPSLQLNLKKKIGLGVAFSLAILIICVAIVRMTQVIVNDKVDLVGLAIWGVVETSVAVIVGSLPPLKALLTRGVNRYAFNGKSSQKYGRPAHTNPRDGYTLGSQSRTIMAGDSIPLDDMYTSNQKDGGIYVQKMFETHVEYDNSSRDDDDEASIVKKETWYNAKS